MDSQTVNLNSLISYVDLFLIFDSFKHTDFQGELNIVLKGGWLVFVHFSLDIIKIAKGIISDSSPPE